MNLNQTETVVDLVGGNSTEGSTLTSTTTTESFTETFTTQNNTEADEESQQSLYYVDDATVNLRNSLSMFDKSKSMLIQKNATVLKDTVDDDNVEAIPLKSKKDMMGKLFIIEIIK